jgi:DNA (cytosine-5)-methyltransferase 1
MKDFSRISRFGMTFKPLTESRGEELLMSYLEDSRVRTLAAPEKEQESKANEAECGRSSQELLAKYNPSTSSWRTAQCSLLEDLEQSLEIFPKWGSMRNGECYPQPMLAQTTGERESGFVPDGVNFHHTPNTTGMDGGSNSRKALKKRMEKYWLTPATVNIPIRSEESMQKRFEYRKKIGRNGVGAGCLAEQVEWSGTGEPVGYVTREAWPTPQARDYRSGDKPGSPRSIRKQEQGWSANLNDVVMWPTPTAHNAKETNAPSESNRNTPTLAAQAGGQLNPTWVEWLMGWPLGWTDLKPSATDKFHSVPQQPLNYLERD